VRRRVDTLVDHIIITKNYEEYEEKYRIGGIFFSIL
jgi:hypothetical protein